MACFRRALVVVLLGTALCIVNPTRGQIAQPRVVFEDHFSQDLKPQWSARKTAISTTPVGDQKYLGPFGPEAVQLNLAQLPDHQFVQLSLDLLIIRGWNGNVGGPGPDIFCILTDDGRTLACTSFGWTNPQAFPGIFGIHSAPPSTGSSEVGKLGFTCNGGAWDAIYHIECVLPHHGPSMGLRFVAGTNSTIGDAAWGITSAKVALDGVTAPDVNAIQAAWQRLGQADPAAATGAIRTLVMGRDASVAFLKDKLTDAKIPPGMELLDPSHGAIRTAPAMPDVKDAYVTENESLRRTLLAGHVLQIIGSDPARALLREHLLPPSDRSVNITVKHAATGAPVAFLPIWAVATNEDQNTMLITDAQGRATLEVPQSTKNFVNLQTAMAEFVPLSRSLSSRENPDKLPQSVEFQLEKGTAIGGSVVDDANQPVDGATVVFLVRKPSADPSLRLNLSFVNALTDKSGRWSFDLMPAEFEGIELGVYHPRYASQDDYYAMTEFKEPLSVLREGKAVLKLRRGTPIRGIIYDSNGQPLANARIGLGTDRVPTNALPGQLTDANGRFVVAGLPGTVQTLTVQADGYAPDIRVCAVGSDPLDVEFRLSAGSTLKGRVVDSQGQGIAGATIFVDTWRQNRTLGNRLYTDASGNFVWKDAPGDAVLADVLKSGYADNRRVPMTAGADNIVTLKSPTRISGTVVDDATGEPIKQFAIVTGIQFDPARPMFWSRRTSPAGPSTGKDGKFEQTFSYPYPAMAIRIEADGYLPADTPTFPLDSEAKTFELRLKKGKGFRGVVVDATGAPAAGADVIMVLNGQSFNLSNGIIRPNGSREAPGTRTAADGSFTLQPQLDEFAVVVVHDKGYARLSFAEFKSASGPIKLQAWAKIEGTVKVGGKPAKDVRIMGSFRDDMNAMQDQNSPHVMNQLYGTSDEQGRFHFDRVVPGQVSLGREVPEGGGMFTSTTEATITAKPGETATVNMGDGQ